MDPLDLLDAYINLDRIARWAPDQSAGIALAELSTDPSSEGGSPT